MDNRFTKIKYDGSKMRIEYEVERKDAEPDEYTLFSSDKPAPEFDRALQALTGDVLTICEMPDGDASVITVRGVSLTHTSDVLGVCVTALKSLKTSNAPLVLNTPHLPEVAYSGDSNDANPTMPVGMSNRLRVLMDEAERYVNGDRAQARLFSEERSEATTDGGRGKAMTDGLAV